MRRPTRYLILLLALISIYGLNELLQGTANQRPAEAPAVGALSPGAVIAGERAIVAAFQEGRSGLVVQSAGVVERLLPDDEEGDRHQRFILRLASGHTLLVTHNIDLAPRVPLAPGDSVEFRGQYEWNEQGGVIHWTHHDPQRDRPGGWIRHAGRLYR
ncbi:MAG: DUF3465 domain-containing protein [Gemmatimonadales bacterium]|jgi:hypothetical protein